MLLPEEEWLCVSTFNKLDLQHDRASGRGKVADRQDEVAWKVARQRWHEGRQEETTELKHATSMG